jgi:hypothetical protein
VNKIRAEIPLTKYQFLTLVLDILTGEGALDAMLAEYVVLRGGSIAWHSASEGIVAPIV